MPDHYVQVAGQQVHTVLASFETIQHVGCNTCFHTPFVFMCVHIYPQSTYLQKQQVGPAQAPTQMPEDKHSAAIHDMA